MGHDPCGLRAPLDSKDRERLPNPLVNRVGRDPELGGDLLRVEVLVDETEAVKLTAAEARDSLGHGTVCRVRRSYLAIIRRAVRAFQANPHCAQHGATPEQRV
ncbi:MAG: hypothetical protein ACJ8F4_01480 [Sphingomonas sp.]